MPIRRSGTCDQRRRRVLIEEQLYSGENATESGGTEQAEELPHTVRLPGRRYSGEAAADQQQPLTAVIPKRVWTLAVLALTGLSLIAGIEALYGVAMLRPSDHWLRAISALDVSDAGGLGSWFSSIFLLAAAIQGLQIYRLRRHRADDYRGRYRVWVWISPSLLLASLVVGTHLHRDLFTVGSMHSEALAVMRPELASCVVPAVLWLLVALRLVFEVRESRASLASLVCATLAYSAAGLMGLLAADEPFFLPGAMIHSSLTMLGHLATLLMVASYSRYVYLDAQGTLVVRQPAASRPPRRQRSSRKQKASVEADQGTAKVIPISEARSMKEAKKQPIVTEKKSSDRASPSVSQERDGDVVRERSSEVEPDDASEAGLSKAERRRLRKLKRREQARRAA